MILSQNSVLASLNDASQAQMIRQVNAKYAAKNAALGVFGIIGLQSTLLPAAKLLAQKGNLHVSNEAINRYLESGQFISQADVDAIYSRIKN